MLGMSLVKQHMPNTIHLESGVIMREPDDLLSEMLRKSSVTFYKIKHEMLRFRMFGIGRR